MPFSFHGFGTAYYGECDFRPDGSYVTTEWISAFLLPVLPFRSVRLVRMPGKDLNLVVVSSEGFLVIERTTLHWRQVMRTYGFMACYAAYLVGLSTAVDSLGLSWGQISPTWAIVIFLFVLTLPLFLLLFLRDKARRRAIFSPEAQIETLKKLRAQISPK